MAGKTLYKSSNIDYLGNGMNKKILIGGSAIAVVVLVLASFSPVAG